MPNIDVVELSIKLRCVVWKDDVEWISCCPSLDVYSQGESREHAQKSIKEVAKLWIASCLDRDTLSEALAEVGWTKFGSIEEVPDDHDTISLKHRTKTDEVVDRIEFPIEILVPAYQAEIFLENRAC